MNDTVVLGGESTLEIKVDGECNLSNVVDGMSQAGIPIVNGDIIEPYEGDYEITPSPDDQTLPTKKRNF